ncbi:hypothetical protein BsWGS_24249 [Bradybaena similaris]
MSSSGSSIALPALTIGRLERGRKALQHSPRGDGTPVLGREKSLYTKPQLDRCNVPLIRAQTTRRHIGLKSQYSSLTEATDVTSDSRVNTQVLQRQPTSHRTQESTLKPYRGNHTNQPTVCPSCSEDTMSPDIAHTVRPCPTIDMPAVVKLLTLNGNGNAQCRSGIVKV